MEYFVTDVSQLTAVGSLVHLVASGVSWLAAHCGGVVLLGNPPPESACFKYVS